MKVLYDHQCFTNQEYGGISRYFVSLLDEFAKMDNISTDLALKFSNNFYLKNNKKFNIKSFFSNTNFRGKKFTSHLINMPNSKSLLRKGAYDIFHPTYYNPYFLKSIANRPFIITVYDMTHELFPNIVHWFDKTVTQKKYLTNKAQKVVAISNNTKRDLIKILKVPEEKIEVVHLASSLSKEMVNSNNHLNLPERYILFVGSRNYYKNFTNTIIAFNNLIKNDDQLFLVCAGGGKFNDREIQNFKMNNLSDKILHRQADDISLASLYSKAMLFIFPSLYEGFGIPALEAMNCDAPLALSNISSLPEVGGDAAVYFDPKDPNDITKKLSNIIYDDNFRSNLIEKGKERRKNFSWQKTAIETKKVYEQIL
jgi:glycosyltransferase involved in cell wall biosynthesis